ncbi:hypothetical protein [Paenibacillus sp. NAIST15-1]|uniref:hypothetical protein n=1 Tax=Paenibacillus sp. NAIST15-1 TaxID=1605994 RepID=UPI00086B92E9|nr:hypothetical protein [Paenibacillus sp. NAIST15-1]GAV11414.1 hypothetical protein PBN151_1343 [Paenibacillus sp. NAIST15-1]
MTYSKPKCHCGTELVHSLEYIYREDRRISLNGQPLKNKCNKPLEDLVPYDDPHEYLRCPECYFRYEMDYDEQGRIITIGGIKPHPNDTGLG